MQDNSSIVTFKDGDIVSVSDTYEGWLNRRKPATNGVVKLGGAFGNILVKFDGWGRGHMGVDGVSSALGDHWFIPADYLEHVIQLPDETVSEQADEPVVLYPSDLVILKHLKARGSISAMEALVSHGCPRLAPRIFNLRKAGHEIVTSYHNDQSGHRYSRYTLQKESQA